MNKVALLQERRPLLQCEAVEVRPALRVSVQVVRQRAGPGSTAIASEKAPALLARASEKALLSCCLGATGPSRVAAASAQFFWMLLVEGALSESAGKQKLFSKPCTSYMDVADAERAARNETGTQELSLSSSVIKAAASLCISHRTLNHYKHSCCI